MFSLKPDHFSALQHAGRAIIDTAGSLTDSQEAAPILEQMLESAVEMTALTLAENQEINGNAGTCETLSCRRQTQLIRKAEEFCHEQPGKKLRITNLCSELGINERTLRHAFHERIDISPLDYLKASRLNRVFKELREKDQSETLIKRVAIENGFSHMGQFCHDYKKQFGESPSYTLQHRRIRAYLKAH